MTIGIWNKIVDTQNYGAIDVCKLFMAFVVIAIHTNPIVNVTNPVVITFVIQIENLAVPFFFVASGFFLWLNIQLEMTDGQSVDNYLKKYLFRIIRCYCVWSIISLPLTIYGYYIAGEGVFHCVFSYIKYFLFVGKLYNSYHLWYLLALIYSTIVIWLLLRKKISLWKVVLIGLLLCFMADTMLLLDEIEEKPYVVDVMIKIYKNIFNKGGIFTGMIYISLGMLVACKKQYIKSMYCILLMLILNVLQKQSFISNVYILEVSSIIESVLFFMLLLNIRLKKKAVYMKCRQASTIIYLSHLIFFSLYTIVIIGMPNKLGMDSFICTALISSLYAGIFIKLKEKDCCKWLKKIV